MNVLVKLQFREGSIETLIDTDKLDVDQQALIRLASDEDLEALTVKGETLIELAVTMEEDARVGFPARVDATVSLRELDRDQYEKDKDTLRNFADATRNLT